MNQELLFQDIWSDTWPESATQIRRSHSSGNWSAATYQIDRMQPIWIRRGQLRIAIEYLSVSSYIEFDSSSKLPRFSARTETANLMHDLARKTQINDLLEHEVFLDMPPNSKVRVTVRIRKISKAEPCVLKPEEI